VLQRRRRRRPRIAKLRSIERPEEPGFRPGSDRGRADLPLRFARKVAKVRYAAWTADGNLWHPTFAALRGRQHIDRKVIREIPAGSNRIEAPRVPARFEVAPPAEGPPVQPVSKSGADGGGEAGLTNPQRSCPRRNLTKLIWAILRAAPQDGLPQWRHVR